MEYEAILPTVIDSTQLTTFRSCPRKFYWEFVLGLRPRAMSVHLHAGGAFAAGMEAARAAHYLAGKTMEESTWEGVRRFIGYWGDYEPTDPDTPKTFYNTLNAFVSYLDTYPFPLDHIQPLLEGAFEYSFSIPTVTHHPNGHPFLFGGKIDLLGKFRGLPAVVDEKTTTQLGASYAKKWQMRGQFLGYCWAVRQGLGVPVDTAVVRATAIRKTGCDHLEVPQPYSEDLISKWAIELEKTLERIVQCWKEDYWPYDFGDACVSYSNCPYTLLCTSKSGKESQWFSDYEVRRWNPILKNPVAEEELTKPLGEV